MNCKSIYVLNTICIKLKMLMPKKFWIFKILIIFESFFTCLFNYVIFRIWCSCHGMGWECRDYVWFTFVDLLPDAFLVHCKD